MLKNFTELFTYEQVFIQTELVFKYFLSQL